MSHILYCAVCAVARELPQCQRTFGDDTLNMRTGKIHSAKATGSAQLANCVPAHFLHRRELADLRVEQRSAGRSRQPADFLPVFTAPHANSGPLEDLRRPACT
jgi:hypothetical protein